MNGGDYLTIKARDRFKEILKVLATYGFGYLWGNSKSKRKKSPENLRRALEELGPTFIKIGQILSTRKDILPDEYIHELKNLQDNVPIEEFENVNKTFYESVGKEIDECFLYFNKTPIASASIAQVFEGVLLDGTKVVIKIQRRDIYELMTTDIRILTKIFSINKIRKKIEVIDPIEALKELKKITEKELDFIIEMNNMIKFKEENKKNTLIRVPTVFEGFCTKKVLTQEYIDGFKVNNIREIIAGGYNTKEIIKKLSLAYCDQVFKHGFFHGDPHPGNILISNGKLCFIDFGIMGVIDDYLRGWLNEVMLAMALEDKDKIIEFILAVGIKTGKIDKNLLYEGVTTIFDNYLSTSLKNIKIGNVLEELASISMMNNIAFPTDLVLLMRGLLILEGVAEELDPNFDVMGIIINYIKIQSKSSIFESINTEEFMLKGYSMIRDSMRIPKTTYRVLRGIEEGRTKIQLNVNEMNNVVTSLDKMINRIVGGMLIASLIIGSSLIISSNVGPIYKGISLLGAIGYIVSGIFAIILLVSMIKSGEFRYKKK
ncbi:MAG: ABC1 kinase family protein [Clostridium sp.]